MRCAYSPTYSLICSSLIGTTKPSRPRAASSARTRARRSAWTGLDMVRRSEEHTSELQSLMRISYAVFCLKKKTTENNIHAQQKNSNRKTIVQHVKSSDHHTGIQKQR